MKMTNTAFDDPDDLKTRLTFIHVMHILALLDYARRYFERKGDRSSIRRAQRSESLQSNKTRLCLHCWIYYTRIGHMGLRKTNLYGFKQF